ncbi:hypothetical protein [Streptosporangium amethystogenes]|uniref:hypothetical protein n=1 Tax=Streptosporangium amethystogenes TaxID=2002 RepID=UPI0006909BF0|nr:hypothetical protein [Streptosporangium amethystogenes]
MTTGWLDRTRGPSAGLSAGKVLAVVSVVPALVLAGWLLAGLPLLLLGWFRPLAAVPLGLSAAALLCRYGLRRLPETIPATAWQVSGVIAVALASGVFNGLFRSEQLIVRRDPATYAQYGIWLARHGSLPVPFQEQAFGGLDPALHFDSVGFYGFGGAVVPQFMPGAPMLHAVGAWLGDVAGLLLVPPVLGAAAVLVLAGVVARFVGARWAPLAALVFAVSLPILYTSRTTFSEIPSLILLFGGLALLYDAEARLRSAVSASPSPGPPGGAEAKSRSGAAGAGPAAIRSARTGAALAGLVFGLAVMVRIDGLRDVLPVLVYAGLLIAVRRAGNRDAGRLGVPLLGGLAVGAGLGFAAAYLLSRPYLTYLSGSLVPLLAICGAVVVLTVAVAALAPRLAAPLRRVARMPRLPEIAGGLVVLVGAAFAARPWLQTVIRPPATVEDRLTADFIAGVQRVNGLPIDGSRLYYENSAYWVIWYVGLPAALLATFAAALLTRRLVRGMAPEWLLPLAVIAWTTVTTLYRPGITPDQPWAARRLVPVVIPGLILLAVWGLDRVRERARGSGYGPRARSGLGTAGAVLLLAPVAFVSGGTAFTPIERGERAAVEALCAALPARASVLVVERVTAARFTQLVRSSCGLPAARVTLYRTNVPRTSDVTRLAARIRAAGRVPVLLAAEARQVSGYGTPVHIMNLRVRQDERSLVDPPNGTWSLAADVWMTVPREDPRT